MYFEHQQWHTTARINHKEGPLRRVIRIERRRPHRFRDLGVCLHRHLSTRVTRLVTPGCESEITSSTASLNRSSPSRGRIANRPGGHIGPVMHNPSHFSHHGNTPSCSTLPSRTATPSSQPPIPEESTKFSHRLKHLFDAKKTANFHVTVIIHELANVPQLEGKFAVDWKFRGKSPSPKDAGEFGEMQGLL